MTLVAQEKNRISTPSKIYSDRITDEFGKPLNGLQIRVKGTNFRTFTDANGEFSINAKNGDVIELSKNGRIINSYRLNGSIYYEVEDNSNTVQEKRKERVSSASGRSKKLRSDTSMLFKNSLDSANSYKKSLPTKSIGFIENSLKICQSN